MRHLFTGLALLITGIAIGFLLGQSSDSDALPGSSESTSGLGVAHASTRGNSAAAAAPAEELDPVSQRGDRGSVPTPSEDSDAELHRALLEVAARFPGPMGEGRLSGRVVNESGDPIPGATIALTGPNRQRSQSRVAIDPQSIGRAYDGQASINMLMRSYAKNIVQNLTPAGTSDADADGRFTIDGLAEGSYQVQTYAEGFVFKRASAAAGDTLELVGTSVTTFELDVAYASGDQPESATIIVLEKNGSDAHYRWTPLANEIRTTNQIVTFQAFVGEISRVEQGAYRADARSSIQTIDWSSDGPGPHTLKLQEFPSVLVDVQPGPDAGQPFEPWCDLVRGEQRISVSANPGRPFAAFDVTAGPYTVEVGRGDGPAEVTREVIVAEGRTEVAVELGPLDASRYLVAHCVDAQGRPVQDIWSFGVSMKTGRSSTGTSIRTKARANGDYRLSLERGMSGTSQTPRDSIESLTLVASSPSQGDVTQIVDPSAERVEFLFQTPSDLVVQVGGALDAGLEVFLEVPNEGKDGWRRHGQPSRVPGDGSVAFQALSPGPARVVLEHEDSPHRIPLAVQPIELRGGANKVHLEAPETYDLVVLVPGLGDKRFELWAEENGEFERRANGTVIDGERLVFQRMPAGRYRVQYRGTFREIFAQYVVPCGEVVFSPMLISGFEVTRVTEGSLAEEAGLRVGDVLIGVDHFLPSDESFIAEFTGRVARPEGTNLRIRRGGKVMDVPARLESPPKQLLYGLGARFKALER